MFSLPPTPTLDGLHPLVVHFPIGVLFVAPLFLLLAMVLWKQRMTMLATSATLLVLGTAAVLVTVASGQAAGELADRSPQINPVLERHGELAETVRTSFVGLTLLLLGMVAAALWLKDRIKRPVWIGAVAGYLVVYFGGLLLLANTAHQGGRLVQEFGVRAIMDAPAADVKH